MVGYYNQDVAPFQSGCSMVSSCKDYYNMNGGKKEEKKKGKKTPKTIKTSKTQKTPKTLKTAKKKNCEVCKAPKKVKGGGTLPIEYYEVSLQGGQKCENKNNCGKNKKGGRLIPRVSSAPVTGIQKTITGSIDSFIKSMNTFEDKYKQSVVTLNNMTVGEQRLRGGAVKSKAEGKVKKTKAKKPVAKKPKVLKPKKGSKSSKTQKGGSGASDFASTLSSRGSAIAPDKYWGVSGEEWFRQFNKTAEYIPNSQLAYAAAPELTTKVEPAYVKGFDLMATNYGLF
jgi:hypothetical protein